VRDHGVQGKNYFLAAIEELDQEEAQLEDMLSIYLKSSTESQATGDINKGKKYNSGLMIPFPSSSLSGRFGVAMIHKNLSDEGLLGCGIM
jgi:hypothetical protein